MYKSCVVISACLLMAACADTGDPLGSEIQPQFGKPAPAVVDPVSSWFIPAGPDPLALAGDGKYLDGSGNSEYRDDVCGVHSKIFATTAASFSGDAILDTSNPKHADRKCPDYPRTVTFAFPDGHTEAGTVFANLGELQKNGVSMIAVGETVSRGLNLQNRASGSRCGTLRFRPTRLDGSYLGGTDVLVTRVDASTWDVVTPADPMAYCDNLGTAVATLPLRFRVVSATALPVP